MEIIVKKIRLSWNGRLLAPTHGLLFVPEQKSSSLALLCHGYTSHKGSLLTWASRLAEEGMPTLIFDVPGHYLGNFSEVENFDEFKNYAHELFAEAYETAKQELNQSVEGLVLGGHSLGALLAIKAMNLPEFSALKKVSIAVGLGMPPKKVVHIFDTPFYVSDIIGS